MARVLLRAHPDPGRVQVAAGEPISQRALHLRQRARHAVLDPQRDQPARQQHRRGQRQADSGRPRHRAFVRVAPVMLATANATSVIATRSASTRPVAAATQTYSERTCDGRANASSLPGHRPHGASNGRRFSRPPHRATDQPVVSTPVASSTSTSEPSAIR